MTRSFCSSCGTPLTAARDERPTEIGITTCSLDVPDRFPPSNHFFVEEKIAWLVLGDDLPRYKRFPGAEE
jgi:hypothetical protein